MKKNLILLLIIYLESCSSSTMITGSWKSPAYKSKKYENVLVAALTGHAVAKATIENDLADLLTAYQIKVSKSIDVFPLKAANSDSDRVSIMHKVHGKNVDAILTISVLKRETESHYVRGPYVYDPINRFNYYQSFWGYYSYWYPYSYSPDYYTEKIYYLETNLYDVKSENLVWSVQSKTYDIVDLQTFSKEFAKCIVDRLKDDGILKSESQKNK